MHPILLQLGALRVYAYGTMMALAFVVGTWGAMREARARGISEDHVLNLVLIFAVMGVAGARTLFVLLNLGYFVHQPWWQVFNLPDGGLALHGGLVGAIVGGVVYCRRFKVDPWEICDVLPKWAALGIGITRFGCLMRGCCYGIAAKAPWGLDCSLLHDTLRYPTQLYEAGLDFILFAYLLANREHRHFRGWPLWVLIGGYSVIRSLTEILRDDPPFWGPFKLAQLVSIILAVVAFAMIPYLDHKRPPTSLAS